MAKMVAIINNAIAREKAVATVPFSHFKKQICEKLVQEQSLAWCKIKKETIQKGEKKWEKQQIEVGLRFKNGYHIHNLKVLSKPSQHFHCSVEKIKKDCQKWGKYLISTSRGLLTKPEALKEKQGGKLLIFTN
ncbi:MAG: 30S ribosomal protein S8 [Candidatus Moeniiplasma glomeromycotorum]|nr:30S ribosomal protein S8 [Candidatus Moeniiplasma glomeromycotorum]MCE8162155.1 30S ribosomal protein S8 [Candidatus Moeniiplasma glomeromycotorum]MCE8166190.1 30S ribosomal protein S8 [Candidatus Moeniiplasma glomeromycotorum]MCE8166554.1 30S ribosomal protein S8 [Candidatus Moeniiplasma glomeromycotorum]